MSIRSYELFPNAILTISPIRHDSEYYNMASVHLSDIGASGSILNIPIGPPLQRYIQIFQIRMTCDSPSCEWALHTRPYAECQGVDWLYKGVTDKTDEILQETWLAPYLNRVTPPYLYFSFKELAGQDPGRIRLELRITC